MTDPTPKLNWNEESEQWEKPTLPSPASDRHDQPAYEPPETTTELQRQRDISDLRAGHRAIPTRWDAIEHGQGVLPAYDNHPMLWLDFDAKHSLHWFSVPIHATPTELRLIILLALHAGEVVSHADLAQVADITTDQIAWHISRIRHKAKQRAPDIPIYSVNRRGYILRLHPSSVLLPDDTNQHLPTITEDMELVPDDLPQPINRDENA